MADEKKEELIGVDILTNIPYNWSMGPYSGSLFVEMKENKKIWGIRCPNPKCKKLLFPPEAMCGYCFTEVKDDWEEIGDEGTVMQFTKAGMPIFDNRKGQYAFSERPLANILFTKGCYIMHWLEETNMEKLHLGMKVKAVWREQGRGRGYEDIIYFRTIEENK